MLVSRILLELDAQLERLQTARTTIASLIAPAPAKPRRTHKKQPPQTAPAAEAETAPPLPVLLVQEPQAVQEPSVAALPEVAKRRGRPRGSVNRSAVALRTRAAHPAEPRALARMVATGPVFVPAAELERRRAQTLVMAAPKPVEAPAPEGTLDALIREVAERRSATAA